MTDPRPDLTRRVAVGGGLGALTLALAGCGIRLEDDAPQIPFVPTREPIPAEAALIALTQDCAALAVQARRSPGAVAAGLVPLHERQHEVLRDALRARGVPDRLIDGARPMPSPSGTSATALGTSTGPSSTPSPGSSEAPLSPAELAAAELATVTDSAPLREVARDLVPTLASLLAQRISAATLLTGTPPTRPGDAAVTGQSGAAASPTSSSPAAPRPSGSPAPPPALAEVLTATRAAAYRLEVAAAQSERATRRSLVAAVDRLDEIIRDVVGLLGDAAPAPRLGEALPFPVTSPALAAKLATVTFTELLAALGMALREGAAYDVTLTVTRMPWWLGEVDALGRGFQVRAAAFPGLA